MKRPDWRVAWGALALGLALPAGLGLAAGLVWSVLDAGERDALAQALAPVLAPRGSALLLLAWVVCVAAGAFALRALARHFVAPAAALAEQARARLHADAQGALPVQGSAEQRELARVLGQLLDERERLRADVDARVAAASRQVEQERNRLAALMSELTQSVVVCNLDGRILLYNQRAHLLFGGAGPIGLGRSIHGVLDRRLVAHALETLEPRLRRGEAQPAAQFVTAMAGGRLLRVQMAPVRPADEAGDAALAGFVLMLDDITRDFEAEAARGHVLHALTEASRAALASMQAALDMLDYPDLDAATRARFLGVIRDETRGLGERVAALQASAGGATHWPLEDMLGADLVAAALRRIEATGLAATVAGIDETLWLRVESFSLLQALAYLATRLGEEFGIRSVQLRLGAAPGSGQAYLDLIWSGQAMSTETVMSWELDPMRVGGEHWGLTVREVVERHGGAFWFERERARHQDFFRLLLPQAEPQAGAAAAVPGEDRPEFYDFDLFRVTPQSRSLEDHPLAELAYTVFDTETTGLDPSQGDEIIQIGAVRIVNGRLLKRECFDQLVDPQRPIPAASIPIHGIRPERVAGQPTIAQVLPVFHAFAKETVLVAHNAAFDMRFLQLKEQATGVVFEQPVLDTLLLSALVHPSQDSHRLEAIAERLGVDVAGRHTALGDALVTAAIFLKLVPLLDAMGIHTLGQAQAAAQRTYQARLRY